MPDFPDTLQLRRGDNFLSVEFQAFAGPCTVLLDRCDRERALALGAIARDEALRIQAKYSRYTEDSELSRLNRAAGEPCHVDDETAALLNLASLAHELSGGRFDISSGVLRRVWDFRLGCEIQPPDPERLELTRARVGWNRVRWQAPVLQLEPGMELDLGGLGKEYAVDRCLALLVSHCSGSVLVNYGGDLACSGPRAGGESWRVGVEQPDSEGAALQLALSRGGLATSGDARRFVLVNGKRQGHLLDPTTGWPVQQAPRSVTVGAETCSQAGLLASLAMLEGPGAEQFLKNQNVLHWVLRDPVS